MMELFKVPLPVSEEISIENNAVLARTLDEVSKTFSGGPLKRNGINIYYIVAYHFSVINFMIN